ncbi:alpha/beta fold hydrolase [Marinomonas colpomeniae]|uniref:Alpha/beta hydrolase n=1 Tax=Marinomonas colpomeniae TaxID=2774408 RepID=A0ABR8P0Y7_9GAMM|nr:alpha/beta hydrolase [Marinomonas colpomeniae]MBD5771956.1 alpha/beta hydrolase [Marinomonas colpomeniae]
MSYYRYGAHANANGIRQHYLRYGKKDTSQPVLLLIPGITSPAITWGFVAERLAEYFDTYVLDARGRGLSSTGPELRYDADTCADDIVEFAKALNFKDFVVLGHSMGARFITRALARGLTGVSNAVLVDPPVSGPSRRAYPSKLPWYVDSIKQSNEGMSAEDMLSFCPTWTEEQRQLRAEWLHTCYSPAIVKAFNDFHDDDFHKDLPGISVPVVLMVAGKGGVIQTEDEEEIASLISELSIHHVMDAGHMIPWDDFDGFFAALTDANII